jgi:hypothetical protein
VATQLSAEQILGVTHSLKAHVYGPVPSHLAPEDRALVIERELEDLIEVATDYADTMGSTSEQQEEIDRLNETVSEAYNILVELSAAAAVLTGDDAKLVKVGDLVVGTSLTEEQRTTLRDVITAAKRWIDGEGKSD